MEPSSADEDGHEYYYQDDEAAVEEDHQYDPSDNEYDYEEEDQSPISMRRDRLRSRLSRLESDNKKFADVAERLGELAREEGFDSAEDEIEQQPPDEVQDRRIRHGDRYQPRSPVIAASRTQRVLDRRGPHHSDAIPASERHETRERSRMDTPRFPENPYVDEPAYDLEAEVLNLREELHRLDGKLARKDEKLRKAQQYILTLEKRIAQLEDGLVISESSEVSGPPDARKGHVKEQVRPHNLQASALRTISDSQKLEQHFRTMNSSRGLRRPSVVETRVRTKRRPPFIPGGDSKFSLNQAVPIPNGGAKINRLKEDKRILTEEYRRLLRHGNPEDKYTSQRLRDIIATLDEKERELRALCAN